MILIRKENHGCIYTIDPESNELYYAPVYQDNTVNLSEFAPVDLDDYDDVSEIESIQQQLIQAIK
jgi:hypothetical protein